MMCSLCSGGLSLAPVTGNRELKVCEKPFRLAGAKRQSFIEDVNGGLPTALGTERFRSEDWTCHGFFCESDCQLKNNVVSL